MQCSPAQKPAPARYARAASHLARQHLPRYARQANKQDAGQRSPIRNSRSATLRTFRDNRQRRLDRRPWLSTVAQGMPALCSSDIQLSGQRISVTQCHSILHGKPCTLCRCGATIRVLILIISIKNFFSCNGG